MAIRSYDILLDSYNSTIPEPIVGRQGDKNGAVTLHVTITDRGTAIDLTGQTINLMAETAKGNAIVADNDGVTVTNATGGKFDYAIPNALWSEAGKIKRAYFSLNDADGQQTTYDLIFIVKKAVDIDQKHADDYVTIIDGTIRSIKEKIDAMNTDVQTVLNVYNQGDFYNKSETDDKDTATLSSAKSYADNGDFQNKKYIDDFVNESIPQNVITITHNLNKMMLAVVYYYSNAIETETGGLATGPTGSFGGMPLKTVASQTEITSLNEIKVTIPNNFKLTGTPTLGGDGNYFINQNEYTLKFKLVYYE